jgi:hypothetical protein
MTEEIDRRSIIDEEQLRLLSLGYMISGGFAACLSLFGLMYVLMGVIMGAAFSHLPETPSRVGQQPPAFIGWIFACIGLVMFVGLIAMAAAKFRVAWCIRHRKSRTFCMVIAAIGCLEIPYGTLLGVFSFLVLGRDSVARLFTSNG